MQATALEFAELFLVNDEEALKRIGHSLRRLHLHVPRNQQPKLGQAAGELSRPCKVHLVFLQECHGVLQQRAVLAILVEQSFAGFAPFFQPGVAHVQADGVIGGVRTLSLIHI